MSEEYQKENDQLIDNFLNRTWYKEWRNPETPGLENFRSLEFMLNYRCNLACQYCYVNRYGEELYPSELYEDEEKVLKNLNIYLDWLVENNFQPRVELFSGEALCQRIGHKALEMIIEKLGEAGQKGPVIVPTNYTFILSKWQTKNVERLIARGAELGINVSLSASFDGKYCEGNRPFRRDVDWEKSYLKPQRSDWHWEYKGIPDPRNDEYYDKCFAFAAKYKFGFHPMIYSHTVDKWIQNFKWFQEMFMKHNIPWDNIYLLEVRNPEWTKKQILDFGKFVTFLVEWAFNKVGRDRDKFLDFIYDGRGFNMLSSPLSTIGRGIGCSYQSCIYLRLGDLSLGSCHRTSYEPFILGQYQVENDEIVGLKTKNIEHWIASISFDSDNFPYCEQCMIKKICSHGCLGAQLETTGDPFTPFPTMCQMEHEKLVAMMRAYKKIGVWNVMYSRLRDDKKLAFDWLEKADGR